MKQKLLRAVSFLFLFLLIVSAAGCGRREETKADEGAPEGEEYTIGVLSKLAGRRILCQILFFWGYQFPRRRK